EVLDLLLAELDVFEPGDDLVIREEPSLQAILDELLELLDVRKSNVDGEHGTSAFSRDWRVVGGPTCDAREPEREAFPGSPVGGMVVRDFRFGKGEFRGQ